jgi:hypothetical protein
MVLVTLAVQLLGAALLGGLGLVLVSREPVRRPLLTLRRTPLPRLFVYGSVALTAVLLSVAAGGLPVPAVEGLSPPTLVLLVAGLPVLAFGFSGHLELVAAVDVLAELADGTPAGVRRRAAVARYLVRTHYDWGSTGSFLAGLVGLTVGVALSLGGDPTMGLWGRGYTTLGLYGLGVAGATADYPYLRAEAGPAVEELDRLVAAREG